MTVAGTWLLTTILLALLISQQHTHATASDLLSQASASALLACVVIAGPATATALRVRRYCGFGPAALAGLAVAAGIVILITVVQLGLALAMRGRAR